MSGNLKLSTATERMVLLVGAADHITGLASATLTITASKAGAAFASISPTVTDRGSGWYSLALTTTHTNTLGDFALHITAASADPIDVRWTVEPVNVEANVATVTDGAITLADFATDARGALGISISGLATAFSGTTVQLPVGASSADSFYLPSLVMIVAGTGVGQYRAPTAYVGATRTMTVPTWTTTPDGTSMLCVFGVATVDVGTITADVTQWNGTNVATPTTAGVPRVDIKAVEANAFTTAAFADDALTAAKIADDAIGSAQLAATGVTKIVDGVWNALVASYVAVGSMGLAQGSSSAPTANEVRDAILDYAYRTGRTVRGLYRRLGAGIEGKATGLIGATATFLQPDGTTTEFSAAQSVVAGTRETATVTNSEVP